MTRATTRPSASAGRGGIDEHRRVIEILRRQDTGRRERGDHPAYRLFRLGEIRAHQPGVHQVLDHIVRAAPPETRPVNDGPA